MQGTTIAGHSSLAAYLTFRVKTDGAMAADARHRHERPRLSIICDDTRETKEVRNREAKETAVAKAHEVERTDPMLRAGVRGVSTGALHSVARDVRVRAQSQGRRQDSHAQDENRQHSRGLSRAAGMERAVDVSAHWSAAALRPPPRPTLGAVAQVRPLHPAVLLRPCNGIRMLQSVLFNDQTQKARDRSRPQHH